MLHKKKFLLLFPKSFWRQIVAGKIKEWWAAPTIACELNGAVSGENISKSVELMEDVIEEGRRWWETKFCSLSAGGGIDEGSAVVCSPKSIFGSSNKDAKKMQKQLENQPERQTIPETTCGSYTKYTTNRMINSSQLLTSCVNSRKQRHCLTTPSKKTGTLSKISLRSDQFSNPSWT